MKALLARYQSEGPTIVDRWRAHVAEGAERRCIYYGEWRRWFSYGEIDRLTNRIANSFTKMGLKKGDRIATSSSNALVAALTMLASWKIGALYCPLNYQLRDKLLAYVINDIDPQLLVSEQTLLDSLNRIYEDLSHPPCLVLHSDGDFLSDNDKITSPVADNRFRCDAFTELLAGMDSPVTIDIDPGDYLSIIYTSGTTGFPKGVLHKHAWLRALCCGLSVWTDREDVIYCDLPMYHIGGAFSLLARAFWVGAAIGLWDRFSESGFWRRIDECGASLALLVGVMIDRVAGSAEHPDNQANSLAKVHMQPLPANHREIAQRFGFDFVISSYGSTEVGSAFIGFIDEFPNRQATPPALWKGQSKQQLKTRVKNYFGAAALVAGEAVTDSEYVGVPVGLYQPQIDSDGALALQPQLPDILFCEYRNKPAETAAAIRQGVFYPPDYMAHGADGDYYFRGRHQGFLRVNGENIAASVVESQLLKYPGLEQLAVVGIPAAEGGEEEVGVAVVPRRETAFSKKVFDSWCAQHLPKFMRPKHVVVLETLPLTPTYKVDTGALQKILRGQSLS